jgi:hypothetical protein
MHMQNNSIMIKNGIMLRIALRSISLIARFAIWGRCTFLVVLFIAHILLSLSFNDFSWLSAFGGLLTMFGVALIFDYSLPENKHMEQMPTTNVYTDDGESYGRQHSPFMVSGISKEEGRKESEKYARDVKKYVEYIKLKRDKLAFSVSLTLLGTFFWAYAGFLNIIVFPVVSA